MESGNSIYIFPIFVNSGTSLQNSKGESQCSNTNQSTMANLTLVSKSSCNVIFSTFATPNVLSRSEELKIGRPSLGNKQIISTSDLEGYRETLIKLEILERVVDVIVSSKRQRSSVNYNSSCKIWISWCYTKQVDPFRCPINYVPDFLACLCSKGSEFRSINCHRSDISGFYKKTEDLLVGQHPEVFTLLTVVFNLRPRQPRYPSTWDVQIVLKFIKGNWLDNISLRNKIVPSSSQCYWHWRQHPEPQISISLLFTSCSSRRKSYVQFWKTAQNLKKE